MESLFAPLRGAVFKDITARQRAGQNAPSLLPAEPAICVNLWINNSWRLLLIQLSSPDNDGDGVPPKPPQRLMTPDRSCAKARAPLDQEMRQACTVIFSSRSAACSGARCASG